MTARTTIGEPTEKWTGALEASRDRVLAAARGGGHGMAALAHATAGRMVAAWTLEPASIDPRDASRTDAHERPAPSASLARSAGRR